MANERVADMRAALFRLGGEDVSRYYSHRRHRIRRYSCDCFFRHHFHRLAAFDARQLRRHAKKQKRTKESSNDQLPDHDE